MKRELVGGGEKELVMIVSIFKEEEAATLMEAIDKNKK